MLTSLRVVGGERHDLHRAIEADQERADHGGAAKLHQHFGRDRGGVERRHDQHVGGTRKPAERIGLAQLHVQRHVGRHLAVIFEIDTALVEKPYRFLHPLRTFARRMAEGREREQRQPRLVAERAGNARRLDCDVGDVGGVRHLGDGGVGDQHGAAARQHHRDADHAMAGFRIDAALHVLERHGEIAGHAGQHGVGIAERDHAGGEMIAVLVDQPLAVALQKAVALQPLVQIRGIGRVARRQPRIDDLDAAAELDAKRVARSPSPAPRGRPTARCRALAARTRRRRGSPAPLRPRRIRRAAAAGATLRIRAAIRRRSDHAGCAIAADTHPYRRSAAARPSNPSPPAPPPAGSTRSGADRTAPG